MALKWRGIYVSKRKFVATIAAGVPRAGNNGGMNILESPGGPAGICESGAGDYFKPLKNRRWKKQKVSGL